MKKGELIVLCGKVGAGKTTFAKALVKEEKFMYLSVDEWMLKVYGRDVPCSEHQQKVAIIKEKLFEETKKIIELGISVVLDFGFWTYNERNEVRRIFDAYSLRFYYFDIPDSILFERMQKRNKQAIDVTYIIDEETRIVLNNRFEEPIGEDNVITINKDGKIEKLMQ